MKVVLFIVVFLSFTCIASAQPAIDTPVPTIAEIFLAKANPDGKAGEAAENFLVTDVPIFCVVRMQSSGVASVRMDLIAANVPGVKPGSTVVSTTYTTRSDEDRVNFKGRPHGLWVAGAYRVEIFVADKKVRDIGFEIKSVSTQAEKPVNLRPVRKPAKRSNSTEALSRQS